MIIKIISVGTTMPTWAKQAFSEYSKRMPAQCRLTLHEIPLAKRTKNTVVEKCIAQESQAMLAQIQSSDHVIALDNRGKQYTSPQLAKQLDKLMLNSKQVCLLIGGPDGLSNDCLARANQLWSLSELTLPHMLVRVIVAESLYRAWTIIQSHPYHRA